MPKALHDKLERRATELGLTGERRRAYIYGTLDKVEKLHERHTKRRHVEPSRHTT